MQLLAAPVDRASLPDEVEALKDLLVQAAQAFHALRAQANQQMASLAAQLAEFKRRAFGGRSEVLAVLQPELWQDVVELPVPPEQLDEVKGHRRRRLGRPALDASLPRRRIEHDLSEADKAAFARVERIGEELSETLEYTPAKLEVLQHARLKYRCEDEAGRSTIRTATAQASPLVRSNAGAGLLAHVMVSKYADHNPLARQERQLARHGVRRSRQTLCDWTLGAAELLAPLLVPLKRHVLGSAVIFTDDTTLALKAARGESRGKTVTARLWVYLAGGWLPQEPGGLQRWRRVAPAALYDFTTDRAGVHARNMLGAWRGFLQADDFSGYAESFRSGVVHAACLVHARRRFARIVKDAPKASPPGLAHEAMRYFAEIYRIEGEIRGADPDERLRVRQVQTRPLMAQFQRWLAAHAPTVLPKSPLGEAFGYTLSNWRALNTFVEHGILEADNNFSERAMTPVALSRKNWLFAGSERGGRAAATAFSLIETARLNSVEPYAYLRDVLQRINGHRQDRLAELLPMHWSPA
ncbi:IS66 family transposase [Aquincola sp. MAHUQ-54]|uniref:IS66 family transposase n=1 Tax=Aquincola agrisoli TaxID=3119538 RepID=A0AAW9QI58_9BURK